MSASKIKTLALAVIATSFAAVLIIFPEESFEASIRGLNTWWEIVFPSLLPFFIVSEMLIGFGVVKFIGILLEPLMRPLFKVPGTGGFVWAMGMASGNPAGAKFTARLRQEGHLTRIEAERLVAFTSSSNPLFIFGAVSVGLFYNPPLGILLALSHYLGNLLVGLTMRFYGKDNEEHRREKNTFSVRAAFSALHQTRIKEKRPIGRLLGDAVMSSIQTLLMIGGFIILFSVVNKLLFHLQITSFLASFVNYLFSLLGLSHSLSIPFISGLFEMTIGSQLTSQIENADLMQQAIIVSFMLAFGGFSTQAQAASILAQTDIRFQPFFFARMLQGLYSASLAFILWKPVYLRFSENNETSSIPASGFGHYGWEWANQWFQQYGPVITLISLSLYIILYSKRNFSDKI
ncbi:MAG TPA: sporulation integral membrane protein YlbJ [Chondromyces sp.]|nr:sporulation integral membrane protein YlbJ [Chondromyces sp.]